MQTHDIIIDQEIKSTFLDIQISSYGDVESEVGKQVAKATKAAGQLNGTIFRNEHLHVGTRTWIQKTTIQTYAAETRPESWRTRQIPETTESSAKENRAKTDEPVE